MTMRVRQGGRGPELFTVAMAVGSLTAAVSLLTDFWGRTDPPRWSALPWGRLPDVVVMSLHQGTRVVPWIVAAGVWALATSVGWRLHRRLSGPQVHGGDRLPFDALSALVSVVAVLSTRGYLHNLPLALSMDGATTLPVMQWLLYALAILAAVLGTVVAWGICQRLTSHPAATLAAFALACYVPYSILKARGDAWLRGVFSERLLLAATAVSVSTAVLFLVSLLLLGMLSRTLVPVSERYELISPRLGSGRAHKLACLGASGVLLLLPFLSAVAQLAWVPKGSSSDAPNLVLIVVDTLRPDHLGVYGYPRPTSPNLDAWAEGGAVFQQAYSASSFTQPGTAGIMTSRFPSELGIVNNSSRLPGDVPTLAQLLSDRGFRTAAFIGNYVLRRRTDFFRGFQIYDDYYPTTEAVRGHPEREARRLTDSAIGWLDHARRDHPFFLWVHYQDPHGPYLPPPDFSPEFRAADYAAHHVDPSNIPWYQKAEGLVEPTSFLAGYDNEIRYLDGHLGRLLRRIGEEGAVRPTFVVFTADHGEILDEPQAWNFAHGKSLSEEEVRVPLIVLGPGVVPGRHLAGPVSTLDIVPTLLAVAGVATEHEWRGEDLLPVLASQEQLDANRVVVSELHQTGEIDLALRGIVGTGRSRIRLAPDRSIQLESQDPMAAPLSRALAAHLSIVDRHRRDASLLPLSRIEEERLRSLGYVE